jgi:hypothetical protein
MDIMNKLFTRPWIGVLTIYLLLAIEGIFLLVNFLQNGFSKTFENGNPVIILQSLFFLLCFVFWIVAYIREKKPIFPTIFGIFIVFWGNFIVGIHWVILLILGIVLYILLYFKLTVSSEVKMETWGKYDSNKPLRDNVENAIRSFIPRKKWRYEREYQDELYNWLKRDFPFIVEYELQTGSSRPDLVIEDIAIEIKGPTGNAELNTLTTKFLKYSNHYPHFIIVLFDCSFSDGHFNEIYNGIRKFCPNVIIIRK